MMPKGVKGTTWEATARGAELVVRLRVPGTSSDFPAAVTRAFEDSNVTDDLPEGATFVLGQPLLTASDTEVWELRVSAPSWAAAGAIFDAVSASNGRATSLLRALTGITESTVVSAGAPLYRTWTLAASAAAPSTAE